jgi:hypothetical protein
LEKSDESAGLLKHINKHTTETNDQNQKMYGLKMEERIGIMKIQINNLKIIKRKGCLNWKSRTVNTGRQE